MIAAGAVVPHAPLLTLHRGASAEVERIRQAIAGIAFEGAETVVVLSPHGAASGVYARTSGSLRSFGIPDGSTELPVNGELARDLAARWGRPLLDEDLDHGALVPLRLLVGVRVPVVAACLSEDGSDDAAAIADFAGALDATGRRVAFVASAHTSSALSPRAPLGRRPEAEAAEERLVTALREGAGVGAAAGELLAAGGSCGLGPLLEFAAAFDGVPSEVLARAHPYGVGYLVARATR